MPTYDYICENCGCEFEQFQTITAKPLRKCPKCGETDLKRLIGAGAGVIFKGSGFYETDYRSESYKKSEKKEKDASGKKTEEKKNEATTSTKDKRSKTKDRRRPPTADKCRRRLNDNPQHKVGG